MPINCGNGAFAWFMKRFKRQCNDKIDQFCCVSNAYLNDPRSAFQVTVNRPDLIQKADEPFTFLESMIYPNENKIYKK